MSDRIDEFIIEAREHLGIVEETLLAMEGRVGSKDLPASVDRCFRSIHSIKGDAGFLGLHRIHELAHAMESLLSGDPPSSPRLIEVLLAARDRLAVLVDDANRSHLFDISDVLTQLAAEQLLSDRISIDVDLNERNATIPGGLYQFIVQSTLRGTVREGRIQIDPCDLRQRLPTGPVRWTAALETFHDTREAKWRSGMRPTADSGRNQRHFANLSAWSQKNPGLIEPFLKLKEVARIISGRINFPVADLRRSLPDGPVIWTCECDTTLGQTELVQRFGFETSERLDLMSANDTRTAAALRLNPEAMTATSVHDEPKLSADSVQSATLPAMVAAEKSSTLRIQVELLDRMMTLIGELTLVRNQSLLAFADEEGAQRAIIQRLNSVTSELQDATLRARMQPVGTLFNKFPRMVRDLARQLGKQIEVELHGREVEMDKTILEKLSDPLMHLIRNSVDHGIELPDQRIAKGKPPTGRIVLSATPEAGQIHIQIRDDGRGIDPDAVKAKALSLKLKSEAELNRMSPRDLFSLIFLPGFSTAKKVTEVSGRGVGMDVVRTNIEQLEGTVSIDSAVDLGCSMALRLPLTLAIVPCLIVTANGEQFAVPQRDLEEVVCLHPQLPGRIEQAFDTEVYRLRDRLLPIVRFREVLRRKKPFTVDAKAEILAAHCTRDPSDRIEYLLVLRLSGQRFGLLVDEVRGTQEVVIKPMHASMKCVGIFNGATIMGDGRVALITDTAGIVEHAQLSFEGKIDSERNDDKDDAAQAHRVLLFEYGPDERFALPLLQVRRVEMVSQNRIERVGDREYVKVDDVSVRILRLDQVIDASPLVAEMPLMSLILPKFVSNPIGILASRIVDTESLALELQQHSDQDHGILGSATVRGRLTLFLDMHRLEETLFGILRESTTTAANTFDRAKRLLLIDDTAFFREVVKRYLIAEGYEVVTSIHGEDGLKQLSAGREFDLIVSDIEMPVMDGWEFAREVRRRGITTPMLALTSLSGGQYELKAKECGFDGYEVKLDHERLVRKVGKMLAIQGATT